jgi:antitoxin MazE
MKPLWAGGRKPNLFVTRQTHRRLRLAATALKISTMMFMIYIVYLYILEEIVMQVAKWGNSLAIRLPRSVVEVLGLKEGDSIEIHVADRRVFAIEKAPTSKQLLERLRKYRGRLPATFKFDRLEANERG